MLKRLLSAGVVIALLFIVLLSSPFIIGICTVILSAIALYEAFCAFSFQKKPLLLTLGFAACAIMPFLNKFTIKYNYSGIFLFLLSVCIVMVFDSKKISFSDIATFIFLILLIPFSLSHIIYIRNAEPFGHFYVWLPFIGASCCDTAAFFFGRAFGGKKLCPDLSPNKTISGGIGGMIGSLLGFFIYSLILIYGFKTGIHYFNYYLLAILCSFVAQIGDLTASAIKRHSHIKDFGNILPGHGGILDRIDSLIFTAPIIFIYLHSFMVQIFY